VKKITNILVAIIAALHLGFLVLEMFLWQTQTGMDVFGLTPETAALTAPLAKNQGLYNGFLAAGLLWSFFLSQLEFQKALRTFFLICIIIAGIFGAITALPSILFIQAMPALIALWAVRYDTKT
jgi:putative membrane protein